MPVPIQVDSLDTVDESLKSAYVENDGKFTLDPDKYAEFKATGLKNKNKELLGKISKASDSAKRFEKFAELEDDDLAELLELHANKGQQPPPKDVNNDEIKALHEKALKKERDKWTTEKTGLDEKLTSAERKLKHYELTVPIREAAAKAGVLAEDMEVVLLDTAKSFQLSDEGKIVVLDPDGDPTDITVTKFFETLYKVQRPKFYAASGAAGSGAPPATTTAGGKKVMRRADHDKLTLSNPTAAIAFAREVNEGKASLVD